MALSSRDRVLYARHLLLHEIGSAGQERLCATQVRFAESADPGARGVAADYLARAGLQRVESTSESGAALTAELPDSAAVLAVAGAPELVHAAQALLGALAATEVIKRATGQGTRAALPAVFCLSSEDA